MSIRPKRAFSSRRARLWLFVTLVALLVAVLAGLNQPAAGIWRFTTDKVRLFDVQVPFWRTFNFDTPDIGTLQPRQPSTDWPDALAFDYRFGIVRIPSHGRDRVADFNQYVVQISQRLDDVRSGAEGRWLVIYGWQSIVTLVALFFALVGMIAFFRQFLRPSAHGEQRS